MNWIVLTVLAVASRSIMSIATKLLSKNIPVSPVTQAILMTGLASLLSVFLSPFIGGISFSGISEQIWLVLLVMLSQAFGNVFFYKGLEKLEASTAQVVFSSILIWSVILSSLFLGTKFNYIQSLGILLMMIAILLIQLKKESFKLEIGAVYIIISSFLYAFFQVSSAGIALRVSAGTYLMISYLGPTILLSIFFVKKIIKDIPFLKSNWIETVKRTTFVSLSSLGYFLFSFFAYRFAPERGTVVVLLTSQVVLSVLLAILFLKERGDVGKKVIAGGLAFIASILIKS